MSKIPNPAELAGYTAPRGKQLGWKVVQYDGRTKNDFHWPFKGPVEDPTLFGLSLAKTWEGAALGGYPAHTGLTVAYRASDVVYEDAHKIRVRRARVLGPIDIPRVLREADLREADLHGANLHGADLGGADLGGADLRGADLGGADLFGANLFGANLFGANLRGADLRGADLGGADLRGADLGGAAL